MLHRRGPYTDQRQMLISFFIELRVTAAIVAGGPTSALLMLTERWIASELGGTV
jgi:hypothetical protein